MSDLFDHNAALRRVGSRFLIGDRVRHVTQSEGKAGVVVAVTIVPGAIRYVVAFSTTGEVGCSEFELIEDDGTPIGDWS